MSQQRITKSKSVAFGGRARVKSVIAPPDSSLYSSPTEHPKRDAEFIDKINYYLALPTFSFDNFTVDVTAEPVALFRYTLPESISIIEIPERDADVNYNLVIVIDGVRYKVWNENEFAFPITLYTGQRLGLEFDIEIWATNSDPVISNEEIRMRTSTLLDPDQCELSCVDTSDIQEAYSILIPFQYASFAENITFALSFSGGYFELELEEFMDSGTFSAALTGTEYAPTFDSTLFTFDSSILTFDTIAT